MNTNISYIFTNTNEAGNGVYIGDYLLTAAHVIAHSDNFGGGKDYLTSSALCINNTNSLLKSILCRLSFFRYGWNYDDFAIFEGNGSHSPLTLSPELPLPDNILNTYSIKELATINRNNIFSSTNKERYVTYVDKAKVLYIRGNYIFCEMDGMLEKGRSGCPLIKDNKVYGILRGGDDKKICWFQSSVSILKRLREQGISI